MQFRGLDLEPLHRAKNDVLRFDVSANPGKRTLG
jgi:hypothetical protein